MTETHDRTPDDGDIALLLPWLATGKLTEADIARFETAMKGNPELQRHLGLARDEQVETVRLNEAFGAASGRLAAQVFARIDAEPVRAAAPARPEGLLGRLRASAASLFTAPRPWVAAAAAIIIVAQAGGLAYLISRHAPATYETASGPESESASGSLALVGFLPGAPLGAIAHLLETNHVSIVAGPRAGLFTVRLGSEKLSPAEAQQVLATLRGSTALVTFAAPKDE